MGATCRPVDLMLLLLSAPVAVVRTLRWTLVAAVLFCAPGFAADETRAAVLRHPLEDQALVDPERVLQELPRLLERAREPADARERTLLLLAKANACRVLADLHCQREAAAQARQSAEQSGEIALQVRSLILEGRAFVALQDYSQGERLLGDAELRLREAPDPELAADIDLGYSSMSHALGKHVLAAEYAARGLARLDADADTGLQIRLLRNQSRALTQLRKFDEATALLERGLAIVARVDDPKLRAELHLEQARQARLRGDRAAQESAAKQVIVLADELRNSQLAGQGYEEMGLAARDAADLALAQRHLETAVASFRTHGLTRDELRALRTLLLVMLDAKRPGEEREPVTRRYLALETEVIQADRAQAADDFDARLKYVQQENEVLRLEGEATIAQERERSLAATNRLTRFLNLLAIGTLVMLLGFFVLQFRSNRRLRRALVAQRESESRATDLLRLSTGYVFLHDLQGRVLMMNPAAAEALGDRSDAMIGRDVRDLLPDDGRDAFEVYLQRVLERGQAEGVLRVRRRDGEERLWRYGNRLSRLDSEHAYVVGHAVDVTDQVEQAEALRERSERDALTGAWNRRHIDDFERRGRGHAQWAVVNIDLDHFKQINDRLGHEEGDRVLVQFAQFLQRHVRDSDAVIRNGGDEFLLLLGNADADGLRTLVDRLQQDAVQAPCGFSLGWAARDGDEALGETLARADRDMYERRRAKRGEKP
jgi:diguanylate cyclase (GGDEF)-like protein/PAS domain S-box-containing protein